MVDVVLQFLGASSDWLCGIGEELKTLSFVRYVEISQIIDQYKRPLG